MENSRPTPNLLRESAPVFWALLVLAAMGFSLLASAEEAQKKERPRFETRWVVIMELGEKAADMGKDTKNQLKREHLRYLKPFEESGEVLVAAGFRIHDDERHRQLSFYRGDLDRAKVAEIVSESPMVKAGLWTPHIYRWTTSGGEVTFKGEEP